MPKSQWLLKDQYAQSRIRRRSVVRYFQGVINILVLIFLLLVVLVPILWLGFMSLRTPLAIFEMPPNISQGWTLNNYIDLTNTPFLRSMLNSLIVSLLTTLFALGFGVPAAYALSRYQFKYERGLAFWILGARLALPIGFALPLFIIFNNIGIRNTYTAVVLAYLTFTIPLVIWASGPFLTVSQKIWKKQRSWTGRPTCRFSRWS